MVVIFCTYYGMGTLLFPLGDLSYVKELPQMYRHCAEEDPDINLCDFVFEHLMNIQDGDEADEHEKPHQPVFHHNPVQTFITFSFKIKLPVPVIHQYITKKDYPTIDSRPSVQGHLFEVFHPPSA